MTFNKKEYNKEYYLKNQERNKEYRLKNKEHVKEYYLKNRKSILHQQKMYRANKFRGEYDGLVFWMSKKITKSYNNSDPNIKTAWFWEKAFTNNSNKALAALKEKRQARLDFKQPTRRKNDGHDVRRSR
jgi:hypothetical protein